ncbi:hypothetical protein TNCV_895811 [Trichonephila clavipes]|nr:hypothetical protein TNCV_895811 [Trichonephila clavipes]
MLIFVLLFNEEVPGTYLSSYMTSSSGREFVRFYGGLALLKLMCLNQGYFATDLEKWMITYQQDSRAYHSVDFLFLRRMLSSGLDLNDICNENVCSDFV